MAKNSKPNYTQIPHALIDIHMKDLSECELKALLFIFRNTIGWQKDLVTVSLAMISERTGMDKGALCRSMKSLEEKGFIQSTRNRTEDGSCSATTYEIAFDDSGVAPEQRGVAGGQQGVLLQSNAIRNIENKHIEKE